MTDTKTEIVAEVKGVVTEVEDVFTEISPVVAEVAPIVKDVIIEVTPVVETELHKVLKELDALAYKLETAIKGDFIIALAKIRSHLKL